MGLDDDPKLPGNSGQGSSQPTALEARVGRLEHELDALRRQVAAAGIAPTYIRESAIPTQEPAVARTDAPPPPPMPDVAAAGAAQTVSDLPAQTVPAVQAGEKPVRMPPPVIAAAKMAAPRESFEKRLGSQIFNRIGIVLVLIGMAWFLKYAIDQQLIGPTGRVLIGLIAGAGIVVWSERFRRKGFAPFSYSLKALGSGILYLSLWAAFHIYQLLPAGPALGLMVLVTAWNAWMAWAQDSELLAAYALAGGFITPVLLSTGNNSETFLFSYVLAIDIATVVLVRARGWPRLLLGAFPLTVAFFIAWYAEWFHASDLMLTSAFIVLFDCTFSSVPIRMAGGAAGEAVGVARRTNRSTLIEDILLPLGNAGFLADAFYSVLQDSGHHDLLPWLMLVLAAVYLGFMRLPQSKTASAIHLSIAVVLLTIAVPLKASGHWITASWLVEGLALLWVATRLAPAAQESADPSDPSAAYAANTLRWLASGALLLGFCGVVLRSPFADPEMGLLFFNADMGTALTGVVVFAGAAWLALRAVGSTTAGSQGWRPIAICSFIAIDVLALLLALRELLITWAEPGKHPPFQSAYFVTALIGLAVFAGVVVVSQRLAKVHPEDGFWGSCAALSTIAFNIVAVVTGVREVNSIWERSAANLDYAASVEAALQQALAISAFLMLYGAALLAVGFWKRSAFLRWQALALLVFTILKAFLYDMRNLSQGYRVASFLGLGALLMAISFAYQKDWLNLRDAEAKPMDNNPGAAG